MNMITTPIAPSSRGHGVNARHVSVSRRTSISAGAITFSGADARIAAVSSPRTAKTTPMEMIVPRSPLRTECSMALRAPAYLGRREHDVLDRQVAVPRPQVLEHEREAEGRDHHEHEDEDRHRLRALLQEPDLVALHDRHLHPLVLRDAVHRLLVL